MLAFVLADYWLAGWVGSRRELEVTPESLITGSHTEGTLLEVFERRPTLSGQTRLRTAEGWVSERSRDGKQVRRTRAAQLSVFI